jgi:hypothetical protein
MYEIFFIIKLEALMADRMVQDKKNRTLRCLRMSIRHVTCHKNISVSSSKKNDP